MEIKTVNFLKSSSRIPDLPAPLLPEFAFVGRSNVGKSSLINMLCGQKGLAKTSSTPGKTQLINHFVINNQWYLVDLPGYGYAKVSAKKRKEFEKMLRDYVLMRRNLISVFVLVDSRHAPQAPDLEFMEFLGLSEIPFVIVFTKTDKLSNLQLKNNIDAYKAKLLENWEEIPEYFLTSAESQGGKDVVLGYIDENLKYFMKE